MKILFLCGIFSKEMENEILEKSKGIVHYAANKFQWNLIDGFMNIDEINFKVISTPFIGTYPKDYDDLFIKKYNYIYNNKIKCKSLSFCNLWGYRNLSRTKALKKELQEFISQKEYQKIIMIYSPHTPFLQAAVCKTKRSVNSYMFNCSRFTSIYESQQEK